MYFLHIKFSSSEPKTNKDIHFAMVKSYGTLLNYRNLGNF